MKELINKILKVNNCQTDKFIILNINVPTHHLFKSKFKNTYISIIENSDYRDLFFEHFPYQTQMEFNKNNLLPPRLFYKFSNNFTYLLTENIQNENIEYCPYINFIKNLKFYGTLKQKKDKSVYLEIENDFLINLISNSLFDKKIQKTNNFDINIISKEEYEKKEIFPILKNDLNKKFEFQIKDLYTININNENYTKKLWFLEIESKDLEEFRYKYHLFPKINGYNFSIVLGFIKYLKLRKSYPKMKINIAFFAA